MTETKFRVSDADEIFLHNDNGLCRLTFYDDNKSVCFLSTLVIDEWRRQCGHANEMLQFADNIAKREGCTHITLQVDSKSWKRAWYKRRGYQEVAEGYECGKILMTKKLKEDEK